MEDSKERQATDKTYVKPELIQVPLKPEEAVLGGCRNSGTSGPRQPLCSVPGRCSTLSG